MSKIVISGYYGFNNAGDEALLTAILAALRTEEPKADITVISGNPGNTIAKHQVKSLYRFAAVRLLRAIREADLVISGGGSLLQDVTSKRSLAYYLSVIAAAKWKRKKVMLFAQGIGPIRSRFMRLLTRLVVNKADVITVRDRDSAEELARMGVSAAKVEVTENMLMGTASSAMQYGCRDLAKKMFSSLNNPFVSAYKNKEDSIAAAKKAEQRAQEQRIREERAAAEAKARKEREDAMYAVREQKRLEQERKKAEEEERAKYYITRLNSNEYLYLSNTMSRKEYENFLKNNCAEAFSQYRRGKKHIIAGWTLFGVGLAAGVSGIVYGTLSGNQTTISSSQSTTTSYDGTTYSSTTSQSSFKFNVVGSILAATGSGLVIASIPTLAVGYSKRNKAYKVYNNQCASPTISPLSLNLTAGQNGLGLALQF